jgi:hypothetical protein
MPTQATLQSDFVIGVLTGVLAIASLSLAIFGFVFSTFAQMLGQNFGRPAAPPVVYDLRAFAYWALALTITSSLIAILCVLWIYVQSQNLLLFISGGVVFILILICIVVFSLIKKTMVLN